MTPQVGDILPELERTIALADMVAYAGATWDWYRLHYDPEFVAAAKVPGPVVDGQVFGALFVELVQDALGPYCFVQQLSFTFRNLMFAGETVRCTGTVAKVDGDRIEVELAAVIAASDYGPERPAARPARAVVLLGTADGPGATAPTESGSQPGTADSADTP
ncbi:MaoC/PaaZ C-terminal domain-containing protein [Micromonospora sp. NBC_01813]|uniref:MaoC/PaaZ C-terminal domain-containing protein n=1 Tax=Micromonospora sp. NBC_01813 TaxID=2975988 RepID=UPI002DD821C4|nr:MaoC/PaaZ C-terminal domain-containing protein [Micromonospora sp. NBC_01813]WSA11238.1 MaoC/PaaZ C-terminal domain-containing protein [Micromonospora sp. NBC_01813]